MIDTVSALNAWIPQVQGQYINEDWNPENQGFGAQCWDLAANWSKSLGLPVINTGYPGRWPGWAGNMVSAYPQTPEIEAAYELTGPDQPGLPGDIVVWGDSFWYYPATHVAVLVADKGLQKLCMSQNSTPSTGDNPYPVWSSGPATLQYLPAQGLIGYLRPRGGLQNMGAVITELKELDMDADQEKRVIDAIYENADRIVRDNRAQVDFFAGEISRKVEDSTYQIKTFTQAVVNEGDDRIILDARAQEALTRSEIEPAQLATLVPKEVAQAVIDELSKKLAS